MSNREVVLGVTGSIAAYKACEIASRLVELGLRVTAAMTASARQLVGPATLEALTGQRVITELFEPLSSPEIEHITVATRADLFLIAPATANILAKAAHGIADDWLSTTLLATRAPILFAPAMNTNMYTHPATQANIETLRARGCHFVGPGSGRLACGTVGEGRMIEPNIVIEAALSLVSGKRDLAGKHVVITSGANHEPIDPVRFIGNRSSGKMGRALAMEALMRGAKVTVVSGPAEAALPYGTDVIRVETAQEMANAALPLAREADVFVAAAAVADYRVDGVATEKRKRGGDPLALTLVENPDILAQVGANKRGGQVVVGFAAETNDVVGNARAKIEKKHLDLIVACQVNAPDSGFGCEGLNATILDAASDPQALSLTAKQDLAEAVFDRVVAILN